jgi:DNA-binding MarR family transcriptional regulator
VLDFMRDLWAVDHALQRRSKLMRAVLGVTGPQRLVVRLVGRFPGISAGDLAAALHVHPSTLTGVLRRLEESGVIERRSDARDRRRAMFGLTAAGRRIDERTEGTAEAAVRAALRAQPGGSVRSARSVLRALAAALEGRAPGAGKA